MSSTFLLRDIKNAYERAFLSCGAKPETSPHHIRHGTSDNRISAGARDDAKRQLEEHLSLLCTSILIGGEQYVREFPSLLYVPVLTDILVAAHTPAEGSGDGVNPLIWDLQEESVASVSKPGKHTHSAGRQRGKRKSSAAQLTLNYTGFQMASPIELLAIRALALIAGDVPRGSYALRTTKSPQTIPVLAAYLSDTDFLVVNDELTEELLKCFLYLTLIAHETCVNANMPRRIVELLLVVEQHHLRVLCVQILSNMLARSREVELEEVWTPVLALFVESLTDFLANTPLQTEVASPPLSTSPHPPGSSAMWADSVSSPSGSPRSPALPAAASGPRTVTAKDRALLAHYVEGIAHALDRLFVQVAAMESHAHLIEQFVAICVQLLRASAHVSPIEDRWELRSLALSPLTTLYVMCPTFAVPVMLRLRVWETVCGCMLAAVERKRLEPVAARMPRPPPAALPGAPVGGAGGSADAARLSASSSLSITSASSTLAGGGSPSSNVAGSGGERAETSSSVRHNEAATQPNASSFTSGPVLTTDVMTIPFIADEQELLPMLEFFLILVPCARRGHSHCDYRNTTGPYFRWTWEDDFHNEMECNESLCRRLERTYQLTRHFRTHGRYAMTHGKQRVFYADFLSKMYLSDRKQRHSLHRRPLLAGYVHDSRNAFLHGCTCCAAEPDPLFTTWANRSIMQLRPADTGSSNGNISDSTANVEGGAAVEAADRTSGSLNDGRAPRGPLRSSSTSLPSNGTNSTRPAHHNAQQQSPSRGGGDDDAATRSHGSGMRRHSHSGHAATPAVPSETSAAADSQGQSAATASGAAAEEEGAGSAASRSRRHHHHGSRRNRARGRESGSANAGGAAADDDAGDDDDEELNDELDSSQQGSRRGTRGGRFSFCSCGGHNSTAPHRAPAQRLRLPDLMVEGASTQGQRRAPVTVTMLPLEAMLEDPMEKVQSDPATRKAFLGKDVLSRLVPTMVPVLLSLMDNCVNPLVARHSMTLLLRCLSLCADLRAQVTGEAIELPSEISNATLEVTAPAAPAKEKSGSRFLSFRKWLTGGGSGSTSPQWQRKEWQKTMTALQCFLPSLRDLFVGLYLMEGIHIVAGRQDVFGAMKDDLLMADELARVHIAPEFCSFQLSVPSEQLTTAADAMVLLMGLFPTVKPLNAMSSSSPKTQANSVKKSSFRNLGVPTPVSHESPVESFTTFVKATHEPRTNDVVPLSPLPPLLPGFPNDTPMLMAHPAPPAGGAPAVMTTSGGAVVVSMPDAGSAATASSSPSPLPSTTQSVPSCVDSRGGGPPQRELSTSLSRKTSTSAAAPALAGTENAQGSKGVVPRPPVSTSGSDSSVSNSKTCGGGGGSGGGVFTLHQATLLVNYARQVISRGPRVCASAKQIEQSVMRNEFKSVVVLGSSELNAGTVAAPLRTKELMLRMTPAASCPYHFSFSHCTQNFFDASSSLLQVLTKACGDALSEAAVAGDAADPTVSSPKKGNGARTDREGTALMEARRAGNNAAGNWTGESRDSDNNGHVGSAAGAAPSHSSETPAAVMSSTTIQQAAIGTEEDLPIDLKVSAVPKTVNTDELYNEVNVAASDSGPYHNLPRALRTALLFYDYCKKHDIELRAVMMEDPNFIVRLAESLERWLNTISRMREDVTLVSSMSLVALSPVKGSSPTANLSPADASSTRASDGFRRVHFDSTARGKLLRFVSELGATVSRDLGFANFNLDPSIVVKQPCSFAKRAKRVKSFGAVRHLMWRPLTVSLDMLTPESGPHAPASKAPSVGGGKAKDQPSVLVVYHVPLTVVSGVKLRKTDLAVLPNTTMAGLAAAVAKQVQLPAQPVSPNTSTSLRKTAQPSPAAVALHAVQERLPASEQPAASVLTESSPCLTSEEYFEDGTGSSTRVVTPDRILFFIGDVPMISPLTTLLDALAAYADSGFSLRYLITMEQQPGESEEAHRNRILMSLPTLPFWLCKHDIKFVVLQDPLPMELMAGITLTSTQSQPNARSCSCCETLPRFLCSPQHLFDIAPVNGPVALYAALTGIVRSEIPDEVSVLDSTQRRLSSAVVHQLYQHLSVFMLPPLLYSCGIGTAVPGASFDDVVEGDETCTSGMNFPTASYALWEYPYMFTMDMRVSILRFFISAQRSLTLEHCRHLLQSNQSLLVRRAAGEPNFGAEESRVMATTAVGATPSHADNADKRLDIVGLEWLSEEVLRRRRVTLTVDRRHILQSAEQLFALATCTLPLDVAFKGEAGIGPGPAMEFYELIVEELLKPKYGLFRTEAVPQDEGNVSDLTASRSLPTSAVSQMLSLSLPQASRRRCCNPLYPAGRQTPQSLHYWELLGLLLGRLLMMGETTSLCFHPLFLRRMVGEELMTNALAPIKNNLELLDEPLAASLQRLLTMNAEELEACDLYFTIPVSEADNFSPVTDTEKPMMEDGELRRVTRENVDEYVQRLSSFYLQTVPDLALLYLRKGLQHTVNPLYLELFTSAELGRLFGSAQDKKIWETRESFARCVEAGHGYHKRSDVVQYLLDVVPQWNAQLQHNFLKFVTGSSSVPYGGLTQVIKVVRRDIDTATNAIDSSVHHRNASSAADGTTVSESLVFSATPHNHSFGLNTAYDHTLPTVSTCFLYLKLPQYSSKAVLEERLRLAVCEGSNFFALT